MSQKSKIEWTDATWNPVRGCSRVSEGCRNCYAERWSAGPYGAASPSTDEKFAIFGNSGPRWTGKVELIESALDAPLHWKKPRRIFVNSMSDLFHESLLDEAIDRVFAVMALCPRHTFQVLTKRAERMREYFRDKALLGGDPQNNLYGRILYAVNVLRGKFPEKHLGDIPVSNPGRIPLRNLWLGVSCENQATKPRIELLRHTPAAVRFLSLEPLLEDIGVIDLTGIHQVIVGGESGPGARPMNPNWVRSIRGQCVAAGVPFFFKQWGEWSPEKPQNYCRISERRYSHESFSWDQSGNVYCALNPPAGHFPSTMVYRVGKKAAGCLLDGRTWDEGPADEGLDALDALKQAMRFQNQMEGLK